MNSFSLPTLTGPRVTLRKARAEDWQGRYLLGNSPEIHRLFGADPGQVRPLTEDAAKAWVDAQLSETYAWIIEIDGTLAGAIRLHSVNHADKHAVLALGILDETKLGMGYGGEAMRLVSCYAFGEMGMHRISLRVLEFNDRAIAAYRKVGFVEEGRARESALINGVWYDDVLMGLLESDLQLGDVA